MSIPQEAHTFMPFYLFEHGTNQTEQTLTIEGKVDVNEGESDDIMCINCL